MTHDMTRMATPTRKPNPSRLVSLAEAGRIAGIAKQNVPAAILRGDLVMEMGDDGKRKVTRASAMKAKRAREKATKLAA